MIPKEIKYNLHFDNARGDFLWPPRGKRIAFGNKEHTKSETRFDWVISYAHCSLRGCIRLLAPA